MNFYSFHIGDYASHTKHLTLIEDLAYRRMLDLYYMAEKPLPNDPERIARLIGMRENVTEISDVLQDFFVKTDDGYMSKRCDDEILAYKKKADRARTAAKSRSFSELNSCTILELKSSRNQEPRTKNQEPSNPLSPPPGGEVPDGTGLPDCPHDKIIALYHELLPSNPQVIEWNDTRKGYLRQRWREKAKPNGAGSGYATLDAGLAWWRQFLGFVADSKFLTGQSNGRDGQPPFVADLEWLIRPTNFAKVVEGKYHRGG